MLDRRRNLWGIDLGGTKIEGAILKSGTSAETLFRYRVPTEADQGYEHVLGQVKKLVEMMEAEAGYRPDCLGIGSPGTLIPSTGLMKNSNANALNGKPMKLDLERILGLKVVMANDANCFVLAETRIGVVKNKYPDAKVVFGVILGTGVGGGLVVNGQVVNGFHGIGGEWGHNYLSKVDGKFCYCGKIGCNESILSGPALEGYYYEMSGEKKRLKEIVVLAKRNTDQVAVNTLQRLSTYFGLALSVVINILDPDVIVVGGGVGNIDDIYTEGVANIHKYVFNQNFEAPVVRPLLGDSAGVFGAAFLVGDAEFKLWQAKTKRIC